ncbi:23S rRNA (cytosine1962-C5)-methyltransferase [uncultured Gammaproteobacteria bacterium]
MNQPSPTRPIVLLQPGRENRARHGHPWVYANEVVMDAAARALPPGEVVTLRDGFGRSLGTAIFNPHSLIVARLLTPDPEAVIDAGFIADRLRRALAWRTRLYPQPFYRLIHAEADGLPGLVIDRLGEVVVAQLNTAGMDRLAEAVVTAIEQVLAPVAVVIQAEGGGRSLEGLAEVPRQVVRGRLDGPVVVEENGTILYADLLAGQKTGWFFDQRDNRAFMAGLAAGSRVIDLYSYSGGFAVQCARAGATAVVAVDRSKAALELAERSAVTNGVAGVCEFRRAEVFEELERLASAGQRFDVVIADPPAFAKSRKDVPVACRAYRKLARLSARITAPGGFLMVGSCSHNIEPDRFGEEVALGISGAGRNGRLLRVAGAAPDHPVHPYLPESAYLKARVFNLD